VREFEGIEVRYKPPSFSMDLKIKVVTNFEKKDFDWE
jgi:hypothetical protein